MKRLAVAAIPGAAVVGLLVVAWLWSPFAPSVVVIRNVGDRPADIVLTDARSSPLIWSDELAPGGRKTVVVWFRDEGVPEIRCSDARSRNSKGLDYVTPHTAIFGEIAVNGCDHIAVEIRIDPM